jgi:hypothetical protein
MAPLEYGASGGSRSEGAQKALCSRLARPLLPTSMWIVSHEEIAAGSKFAARVQCALGHVVANTEGGRRWATGRGVAANPGGCDARANLKEGNHVKFIRARNADHECAGLADRRVAGFSPTSAPETGLCRRSGERSSNTAGERRAYSGRFDLTRVVLESLSTLARMPRTRMDLFQTPLTGLRSRTGVGLESVWSRPCDTEGVVKPLVCNGGANTKGVNA